jgi:uncharacterized protein
MKAARLTVRGAACEVNVAIAASAGARMRGLLGRDRLALHEALLLAPCRSIHTFGMRFPIDVLFIDRQQRVVAIHRDVPPRRMLVSLRGRLALEMCAGAAAALQIASGDALGFEVIA